MSSDERDQSEPSLVGWGTVPASGGSGMAATLSWPLLVLSFGDLGTRLRVRPRFVSFFAINSTNVTETPWQAMGRFEYSPDSAAWINQDGQLCRFATFSQIRPFVAEAIRHGVDAQPVKSTYWRAWTLT